MSDATSPTSNRRTEAAERRKQAMALRIAGASFAQIGERLGVSAQAAHKMIVVSLAEIAKQTAESAEQLRAIELQRLDALQAALWADAMRGDEQKTDRVLKVMTRRATLLGLDAPTKQEIAQSVTHVEAYEYGSAVAPLAPRPVGDSEPSGAGEGDLHGPALGEDANGG